MIIQLVVFRKYTFVMRCLNDKSPIITTCYGESSRSKTTNGYTNLNERETNVIGNDPVDRDFNLQSQNADDLTKKHYIDGVHSLCVGHFSI